MPEPSFTLIVVDSAPYGGFRCREALDLALALAAFDRPVRLLLRGPAVNWLRPDQDPTGIEQKNLARNLAVAPVYGVGGVLAERRALEAFGMAGQDLPEWVSPVDNTALSALYQQAGQILQF